LPGAARAGSHCYLDYTIDARRARLHYANVRSRAAARQRRRLLRADDARAALLIDAATAGRADDLADRRAPRCWRAGAGYARRADAAQLSSARAAAGSRFGRRECACIITPKGSSISDMESLAEQAVSDDVLIAEPSQKQT